ncbi:predicted protein [Sclerotinia sclerotiorum 1980 UF-70]|uniref:Uncharacterized protein n=1 Tax=Sclerotinia sclerotiorum (strain ATCC 18683 / 1980 / Ss-1) TaxID=665079 RepID=A7EPG2_SCLS1|nr:predicted protein [Sclerotinia sclerotiorum 1980 UF-70]EDO04728.1 predicted protein [Sclerotinia sclerotiorum 1980 UF-70]
MNANTIHGVLRLNLPIDILNTLRMVKELEMRRSFPRRCAMHDCTCVLSMGLKVERKRKICWGLVLNFLKPGQSPVITPADVRSMRRNLSAPLPL